MSDTREEWLERIARAACDQEGNWWRRVEAAVKSGEQKWIDELNKHHDADIGICDRCGSEEGDRQGWRTPAVVDGRQVIVTEWLCEACR